MRRALLLPSLLVLLVAPAADGSQQADSAVALDLAPVVYLHSADALRPADPARFVALSELKWNHDEGCRDARFAAVGRVAVASLGGADARYTGRTARSLRRRCARAGPTYGAADFTRPLDDRSATGDEGFFLRHTGSREGTVTRPWPAFYEYVPGRYVAYWFFYAASNPVKAPSTVLEKLRASRLIDTLGGHQGDWEHITIRLDGRDRPTAVAFYSHGAPRVVRWADLEREDGRPVVYAAQGSHASYPAASGAGGSDRRCFRGLGCFVDPTERGLRWETREQLADVREQPWYGFGGAWGGLGAWYRAEGVVGRRRATSGPLGPSRWKTEVAPAAWK